MSDAPDTPDMLGEEEIIATIFAPLAEEAPGAFNLEDDAALISPSMGTEFVITTDAIIAGVHFFADDAPEDIAIKALGVNLSDLAAKGADPVAYTLAIALPGKPDANWLYGLRNGFAELQRTSGVRLIGGDTTASPDALMLSVTAIGALPVGEMVRRKGARPGDHVYVSGTIGDAALGLMIRQNESQTENWPIDEEARQFLLSRYLRPQPRLALAEGLRRFANAALDISDGLWLDFFRLCRASGVGGYINTGDVPLSPAASELVAVNPDHLHAILRGGDDYEILAAVSPENAGRLEAFAAERHLRITKVGKIEALHPETVARILDADGHPLPDGRRGYEHFSR